MEIENLTTNAHWIQVLVFRELFTNIYIYILKKTCLIL